MSLSYKEESKRDWRPVDGRNINHDDLKTGSLQRIADACELMAKNHADLVRQRDMYQRMYQEEHAAAERMARRIYSLRGVITRMKRKGGAA